LPATDRRGAESLRRERAGARQPSLRQRRKGRLGIGILERATPQLAIQGDPNVKFDPLKLTWLGSVSSYANDAYLLQVNTSFPAKTVADLKKAGTPARLGTTGAGATNLIFSIICKDVLGLNVQIVRGYAGAAAVFLAQQRAEVDGQINGLSALKAGQRALWDAGAFHPLLAFAAPRACPTCRMCRSRAS